MPMAVAMRGVCTGQLGSLRPCPVLATLGCGSAYMVPKRKHPVLCIASTGFDAHLDYQQHYDGDGQPGQVLPRIVHKGV